MYPDPKKVKDNRITVRLNDYEFARLQLLAATTGEQTSTVARTNMMREIDRLLSMAESMQLKAA
jgi:hypothetical protein